MRLTRKAGNESNVLRSGCVKVASIGLPAGNVMQKHKISQNALLVQVNGDGIQKMRNTQLTIICTRACYVCAKS
jgi:hypothetical protein